MASLSKLRYGDILTQAYAGDRIFYRVRKVDEESSTRVSVQAWLVTPGKKIIDETQRIHYLRPKLWRLVTPQEMAWLVAQRITG